MPSEMGSEDMSDPLAGEPLQARDANTPNTTQRLHDAIDSEFLSRLTYRITMPVTAVVAAPFMILHAILILPPFGLLLIPLFLPLHLVAVVLVSLLVLLSKLWEAAPLLRPGLAIAGLAVAPLIGAVVALSWPLDMFASEGKLTRSSAQGIVFTWPRSSLAFEYFQQYGKV